MNTGEDGIISTHNPLVPCSTHGGPTKNIAPVFIGWGFFVTQLPQKSKTKDLRLQFFGQGLVGLLKGAKVHECGIAARVSSF